MKIVVFGGSGFLGSHVADALSDAGHQVTIFDKSPSPYLRTDQEMILGDVLDPEVVKQVLKGVDVVYNFVAMADIDEVRSAPVDAVKINILGNMHILEAARLNNVNRFIFSSSVYVYSDAGSFYRSTKQSCELFIENYQKVHGLDYTILRYGSLYGPRSDERNWIYNVLKQAVREKKITRQGSGEEIREYIHVLDAARLSVQVLKEEYRNRRLVLTGNQQMKIKDLMVMIQEMLKNEINLEFKDTDDKEHYDITPYVFNPQVATKITPSEYLDMGQGLLTILEEIYQKDVLSPKELQRGAC